MCVWPSSARTIDPNSPPVPVLSPVGTQHPYYAEFGWSSSDAGVKLPGPDTVWTASSTTLAPDKPVKLTWDNGQGLIFAIDIALDDYFMFDVKQSVREQVGQAGDAVPLGPGGALRRAQGSEGTYVLHEGPYGVFNGSLKEFGYSDFKDNKQQKISTTAGWVGITDKYWMATLVPDQKDKVDVTVKGTGAPAQHQVPDRLRRPGNHHRTRCLGL